MKSNYLFVRLVPFVLAGAVFAACSSEEEGSNINDGTGGQGGSAGGTGGSDMVFGGMGNSDAGGDAMASSGGSPNEPAACESFVGLDTTGLDCGSDTATAQIRKANMLLVVDKSGSMTAQPGSFDTDLWTATRTALNAALEQVKGIVSFGLVLFPDPGVPLECEADVCCQSATGNHADVPVGDGTFTVPQILDTLDQTTPGGGTPISAALKRAFDYYTTGEGQNLDGEKFVMLVTDGGPNCNDGITCEAEGCTINIDNRCGSGNCCDASRGLSAACLDDAAVVEQITALSDAGIQTFVVGIPGTERYATYLDQFAIAGGRPNPAGPTQYYAVDAAGGVEGLTDVFSSITTQLINSCDVQLSRVPPDPDKVNVAIDCEVISKARYEDGGTEPVTGDWDLDEGTSPPTVRLLGGLCNYITQQGAERVDVIFGCPPIF